jgi:hypothetical protein
MSSAARTLGRGVLPAYHGLLMTTLMLLLPSALESSPLKSGSGFTVGAHCGTTRKPSSGPGLDDRFRFHDLPHAHATLMLRAGWCGWQSARCCSPMQCRLRSRAQRRDAA